MFVGSSTEGLPVAKAIQLNLDYACEVTIWSQGVFGLGQGTLEALVDRLGDFDFAALVLTPDDVTTSREEKEQSPRDNVLLELGLFIGALGRERTFIVFNRSLPMKLPTDLAGVTPATYQQHQNGNLQASLGAATTLIEGTIQRLGKRAEKITAEIDVNTQFQIIHDLLDYAPEQFIIWMFETNSTMIRQSRFIGLGIKYEYAMKNHSGGQGGFSMDELCDKLPDSGLLTVDLRNRVSLTERGRDFAQWLIDNGHKAEYFRSDVASWGEMPPGGGFPWPRQHAPNWPGATIVPDPAPANGGSEDGANPPMHPSGGGTVSDDGQTNPAAG
tara:strand:- start:19700 stop:20686 length:987 start_codon:yes stop_codon:yes gene_type:complete